MKHHLTPHLEEVKKCTKSLRALCLASKNEGKRVVWLERLCNCLNHVIVRAEKEGAAGISTYVYDEFFWYRIRKLSPHANGETDRTRLAEIGRIGGSAKTLLKKESSRRNGKLGGRKSPDKKTRETGRQLLKELMGGSSLALESVANYRLYPRHLRRVAELMKLNGLTNETLGLPAEWDPFPKSKDPYKRIADAERRRKYL